jgi:hypothetical protein
MRSCSRRHLSGRLGPGAFAFGDVDGDALVDLVVSDATDETISVLAGFGERSFRSRSRVLPPAACRVRWRSAISTATATSTPPSATKASSARKAGRTSA